MKKHICRIAALFIALTALYYIASNPHPFRPKTVEPVIQVQDTIALASAHLDSLPANSMVSFGSSGFSKPVPCPLDTLRGTMLWHSGCKYNDGDTWDHGYYVGKCGPEGWLGVDSFTFYPGIVRKTMGECLDTSCDKVKYHEESYPQRGTFYNASWEPVPADQVYAFIVLYHFKKRDSL